MFPKHKEFIIHANSIKLVFLCACFLFVFLLFTFLYVGRLSDLPVTHCQMSLSIKEMCIIGNEYLHSNEIKREVEGFATDAGRDE